LVCIFDHREGNLRRGVAKVSLSGVLAQAVNNREPHVTWSKIERLVGSVLTCGNKINAV
jgi:hypothetical protein